MNLSTKQITDLENRRVVAKGEEREGGKDWEFGLSRYKLLNIEWRNNKVLLYSMYMEYMFHVEYRELYSISCNKPQWKRI